MSGISSVVVQTSCPEAKCSPLQTSTFLEKNGATPERVSVRTNQGVTNNVKPSDALRTFMTIRGVCRRQGAEEDYAAPKTGSDSLHPNGDHIWDHTRAKNLTFGVTSRHFVSGRKLSNWR